MPSMFLFEVGHKRCFGARSGGQGKSKGAFICFHTQKVGASAFVPHTHCHFVIGSPCQGNTAAEPTTDHWSLFPWTLLQLRRTQIPVSSDGFQKYLPFWNACPTDSKLQRQTQSLTGTAGPAPTIIYGQSPIIFTDYICNHIHIYDTYTRICTHTYVSILGALLSASWVELWLTQP